MPVYFEGWYICKRKSKFIMAKDIVTTRSLRNPKIALSPFQWSGLLNKNCIGHLFYSVGDKLSASQLYTDRKKVSPIITLICGDFGIAKAINMYVPKSIHWATIMTTSAWMQPLSTRNIPILSNYKNSNSNFFQAVLCFVFVLLFLFLFYNVVLLWYTLCTVLV